MNDTTRVLRAQANAERARIESASAGPRRFRVMSSQQTNTSMPIRLGRKASIPRTVRPAVNESLEKSLKDNSSVWAELAKY
jgi:hypothetical protein